MKKQIIKVINKNKQSVDKAEVNQANDDNQQRINATPSARRYARENGVNLAEVSPKTNDVVVKKILIRNNRHRHQHKQHNKHLQKKRKNTINILQNQ